MFLSGFSTEIIATDTVTVTDTDTFIDKNIYTFINTFKDTDIFITIFADSFRFDLK